MPDSQTFVESQKLVRCDVVNRYNESSTRFVALDAFKLWEYLMSHKHGLRVGDPRLCLWVDDDAFRRSASVFERAGATLVDPSCGACIRAGPGVSMSPDEVTVSAINRNFPGRSGPGNVYLASPLVVAASAVAGRIVAPESL